MSLAKVRVGGAWVDAPNLKGAVRVGGNWVDFGPTGQPTLESITWPNLSPESPDGNDGAQAYNLGIRFRLLNANKRCFGVNWLSPLGLSTPPGGTHYIGLWTVVGETEIAHKAISPVAGAGFNSYLFDSPVMLTVGVDYVISMYTIHYVFRGPSAEFVYTPSLNLQADQGKLVPNNSGTPQFPATNFNAWYYVSPLVEV